jgi:hypothetical protein
VAGWFWWWGGGGGGFPPTARVLGKRPGAVRVAAMRGLRRLAAHPEVRRLGEIGPEEV